jgi:hypothetical protein
MSEVDNSRRQLLQRIAYTAPMIATLAVMPSIASAGSTFNRIKRNNGVGNGPDCLPPGLEKNGKTFLDNDDGPPPGVPGGPLNQGGFQNTLTTFSKKKH